MLITSIYYIHIYAQHLGLMLIYGLRGDPGIEIRKLGNGISRQYHHKITSQMALLKSNPYQPLTVICKYHI